MRRSGARPKLDALVRLAAAVFETVRRRVNAAGAARTQSAMVFEGTVVLLKEVAPPEANGTREVIATFRVHRSSSVPAPKFVVLQTTLPAWERLQPGASYLVQAANGGAAAADELAGCTVRSLRDARVEVIRISRCAAAAA